MFWNNFTQLCAAKGLSPNGVAKELSISSGSVTKWKTGTIPQNGTLKKIADYFGVSVSYLLEKKENPVQENGTISIRSRDGSVIESELSDEQLEIVKRMIEQFNGVK